VKRHRPGQMPRTARQELNRWFRITGYGDGYAGKPATSKNAHYQQGWRRGREARDQEAS
jgi:hypothetical protein